MNENTKCVGRCLFRREVLKAADGLVLGTTVTASYLGASSKFGQYWLLDFVAFCIAMVAMRVILVWVYVNTESLFMAQLMHASSSGFLAILVSMSISPANDALFYAVYAVVLWIAASVIIDRYGKNLTA